MRILQVNYNDLQGHIFNGYDLHIALKKMGYDVKQMVKKKYSNCESVKSFCVDDICLLQLIEWEKKHSISHLMIPFGYGLKHSNEFMNADIIHYHILHNYAISLFDYIDLMNKKLSVWTIHDAWIFTGNCIQPVECRQWTTGCSNCPLLNYGPFYMEQDNTNFMWNLKKQIISQINPNIIVASNFMKKYIEQSPITMHFDKIHIIPFGIDIEKYNIQIKKICKWKYKISSYNKVIGFRSDDLFIKGCDFLYEALDKLEENLEVILICVGEGIIPKKIKKKYRIIELGWVYDEQQMIDFLEAVDIFVMPSLAEGFGLMAIEAMAAGCAIVCFKNTVLEEITNAPSCGVAVEYKSSDALAMAIQSLLNQWDETILRGKRGHELARKKYRFEDYVEKHKILYEEFYLM